MNIVAVSWERPEHDENGREAIKQKCEMTNFPVISLARAMLL
jgi:hypothetical protein